MWRTSYVPRYDYPGPGIQPGFSKCLVTDTFTMINKNILPYLVSVIVTYISRKSLS